MAYEVEPTPTGIAQAVMIDVLVGLGYEDPLALTKEERSRVLGAAVENGDLDPQVVADLRSFGLVS